MTLRQFRAQALTGAVAVVLAAGGLLLLGTDIRKSFSATLAGCVAAGCNPDAIADFTGRYDAIVTVAGVLLMAVPGLCGIFWGAPLVGAELAAGTHRLAWTQSVGRSRWLTVKLLVVATATAVVTGTLAALLRWSVARYDLVEADRFAPMVFGARGIVPVACAVFAFALGTAAGALLRRPVPAMAVTLAGFAALQFLVPLALRPHFAPPVTGTIALDSAAVRNADSIRTTGDDRLLITGVSLPNAWVLDATEVVDARGEPPSPAVLDACITPDRFRTTLTCFAQRDLHVTATYQPADRFWPFQLAESGLYLALAGLLVWSCYRQVRRAAA
ncbi:ABC transporter permease subunit [Dactylosporangium sp. CS-033363]|uniref:ABC transporter permease subunit n=1 Tax=Dactylosporangium sp. CS-033363 TaxID=3239935 RepID=UPI003D8B8E81